MGQSWSLKGSLGSLGPLVLATFQNEWSLGSPLRLQGSRWDALGGPEVVIEVVFGVPGPLILGTFQNSWFLDYLATSRGYCDVLGGSSGGPLSSWEVPWYPSGGSARVFRRPLGVHRDGLPVGLRFLGFRGDPNRQPTGNPQATHPSRCSY